MRHKIITLFLLLSYVLSENTTSNYLWPTNTSKSITTLFGEKRSRRFHAGIDVRTFGKIGNKIYAIESGYISRIKISPDGYGKALYLTLDDGNIVLYAHLDKYNSEIELIINEVRQNKKDSFINHYLKNNQLRVDKGDILGYCGDTGSLSGPHLHFEIRDENGFPINPLKNYYSITDTLRPVAKTMALIPLDNNCFINGTQEHSLFNIEPLVYNNNENTYKYFIKDTISVVGKFGVGLEVFDQINSSPFNFGIYEIEMLIDNKLQYKINFDTYNFKHDHLINKEIDYYILEKESRNFHRLFINDNTDLDFIDKKSNKGITLDNTYHNLIINVTDNFDNSIQIQGVIKGDISLPPDIIYDNNNFIIKTTYPNDDLKFILSTRYQNSRGITPNYTQIDSTTYVFEKPLKPYEVLMLYNKKNGITSKPKFISFNNLDPYKISGDFEIEHFNNYIKINFIENVFSGYDAKLILKSDKDKKITLNRSNKNILTTNLIDINELEKVDEIIIVYDTNPEIIFSKKLYGKIFNKNEISSLIFNDFELVNNENSFYYETFIGIDNEQIKITENFEKISDPIIIFPNTNPFKNYTILKYNNPQIKKGGIYQYNQKNEKWIFKERLNNNGYAEVKIYSGGIFCILNENTNPIIKNIFPNNNSYYNTNDLKTISFNIIDSQSNIDYNSISILLNNKPIYFDYIPYRDYVRATLFNSLDKGENILKIFTKDNIGNKSDNEIKFFIK